MLGLAPMSRSARTMGLALAAILLGAPAPSTGAPPRPAPSAQKRPKKRPRPAPSPHPLPPPRSAPRPPPSFRAPPLAIERFSLDNGLRVVLCPTPGATVVVVALLYDAGSHREQRGAAGLAGLVRASMGLGSANLLRGEHDRLLAARGARGWSELSSERVAYLGVLPPGELPLGLWLEADRLKSLQLPPDGVQAQRELLLLELQQRAAAPRNAGLDRLRALVFQSVWPLEHPVAGTVADLAALRPEAAQSFYETHYTASNAILVVTGAIEVEAASQLVHRFFETARRQERPAPPPLLIPEQTSQRTALLLAPRLRAPVLLHGWATPGRRTDDALAVEAALHVLARQRLPARLQQERGLAARITTALEEQRSASLARVEIDLADGAARAEVERIVDAELESLALKGPTEAELGAFLADMEARSWRVASEPHQLALRLGDTELLHGDAGLLAGELPRAAALGREQVSAAAARYLSLARRSRVILDVPGAAPLPSSPLPSAQPPRGKPPRPAPRRPHRPRPAR